MRQLENTLTRALVMADNNRITAADIQLPVGVVGHGHPLDRKSYTQHEAELLAETLQAHQWNIAQAARALGVSRPTLYRRLRTHGLMRARPAGRASEPDMLQRSPRASRRR